MVGGCFDVLHVGHIVFLEEAKKLADKLIILLESDKNIAESKGKNRPINNQSARAEVLSQLRMVDKVISLPYLKKDEEYLEIIQNIKPDFIAVSEGDKNLDKKKEQAKIVGAKVIEVTPTVPYQSSSRIIEIIKQDF